MHSCCTQFSLVCTRLHSFCIIFAFFSKRAFELHSFLHSACIILALELHSFLTLHSNFNRIALGLRSFCTLWSNPRGHYYLHFCLYFVLNSVCIRFALFCNIALFCCCFCTQFAFVLQYDLHDFVISPRAIISALLIAIELHSNCIRIAFGLH